MDYKQNPSALPSHRKQRVFVGGSYQQGQREQLDIIRQIVEAEGFSPIVADEFTLRSEDDIHSETMALLHACGLAVFELSTFSGALMEIERLPDYPTKALVLFANPDNKHYLPSRMLSTFIGDHRDLISLKGYLSEDGIRQYVAAWLQQKKQEGYG